MTIIIIIPCKFFSAVIADSFSLESDWQQVSSGYQDSSDLNNAIIWMVSSLRLISNSSSLFYKLLSIVPCAPNTTGIIVTLHIPQFFLYSDKK